MPDDDLPLFFDGMILVVKYPGQEVPEDRKCFLERHTVLGKVGFCLFPVSFEFQIHSEKGTLTRSQDYLHAFSRSATINACLGELG